MQTTSEAMSHVTEPQRVATPKIGWFQRLFFRWIDKRNPRATAVRLNHKNLYTFPTAIGVSFLGLSLLLWVLGTNYQNNLVLGLSYLLVSIFIIAILHTYANLAGLHVQVLGAKPAFAGQAVRFSLSVESKSLRGHHTISVQWLDGEPVPLNLGPVVATHAGANIIAVTELIEVSVLADKRGYLRPGKLLLESTYPLGLIRCWTWLNLDACAVVFPKPVEASFPKASVAVNEGEHGELRSGGDEFLGVKHYRDGDPIKHIAWKHFARGQGLFSKEYATAIQADTWLQWQTFLHLPVEARLSALCFWALEFERLGVPYGLQLPGKQLPPALGQEHQLKVLGVLARFDARLV